MKFVRKLSKGDLSKVILETIKTAGLLSMMLVAPNTIQSMKKLGIIDTNKRRKEIIHRARNTLLKKGFLEKNPQGFLRLTETGQEMLLSYELSDYTLVIPHIWDKKWRVLIFDIPEYRRNLRDKVRSTLISIGFIWIQDSVWVFPYDCSELITLLKADFKIGKDLLYLVVESIENDEALRRRFGLK